MSPTQVFAAVVIAAAASAAMAIEATQFDDIPTSTLTRAEVMAELAQARLDGTLMSGGEATVFVDRPVAAAERSRETVHEEARRTSRAHVFDELYVGSV